MSVQNSSVIPRHGGRRSSLAAAAVETLRSHRLRQAELRLALGLGRLGPDDLVFAMEDGSPLPPDRLSQQWQQTADALGLPSVTFHAFRHSHASALIAEGLDIVTISHRLGHGSPGITLGIYAHKFKNTDLAAAQAIDAAMSGA
jgi:integrase